MKYSSKPSSVTMGPGDDLSLEGNKSASFSLNHLSNDEWKVGKMSGWFGSSGYMLTSPGDRPRLCMAHISKTSNF